MLLLFFAVWHSSAGLSADEVAVPQQDDVPQQDAAAERPLMEASRTPPTAPRKLPRKPAAASLRKEAEIVPLGAFEPLPAANGVRQAANPRPQNAGRPTIPKPRKPAVPTPDGQVTPHGLLDRPQVTDDWRGVRPWLNDRGVVIDSSLTLDLSRNFRGGVSTSETILRHLIDVNVTLDAERLWGWRGGTLFVDFQSFQGETGNLIVGDFQIFSNIDALPVTHVPQMWVEQLLLNDTFRFKVGMVDANSEFAYTEYGSEFLNSSMGFSPTIFVMPTYPDPATSLNLFWNPNKLFYIGAGVYDGAGQRGVPTGSQGPRSLIGAKLFSIAEAGVNWGAPLVPLPGRFAVGGWYHNGDFDAFNGTQQTGTEGWYCLMEQQLYREHPDDDQDEQGLGLFVQYGQADPEVSEARRHAGAGVAWRGLIPTRDKDSLGTGVTSVQFSDEAGYAFNAETAVELFYKAVLTKWAEVCFDLQYIHHPGGVAGRSDAVVGTSRFFIHF